MVIGAGGLGCPALHSLALRGVEHVGIWDPDRVEISNLHRQILYRTADVGRAKADVAARHLGLRFPATEFEPRVQAFTSGRAQELDSYDLILDCTDLFEVKLAVNDACVRAGLPFVFAAASSWSGQVLPVRPGRNACLRCLFDQGLLPGVAPSCDVTGVFGPLLGIVAAHQVRAGLRILADHDVGGQLWMFDRGDEFTASVRQNPECLACRWRREGPTTGPIHRGLTPDGSDAPEVDLTALRCPQTFVETRRRLERLPMGGMLWVAFSSDESARTVPASAVAAGHRVLARRSDGQTHRILLQRGI
ncbi:MAG: ThiF family adenylyltransferase [Myxococcota bacterium]